MVAKVTYLKFILLAIFIADLIAFYAMRQNGQSTQVQLRKPFFYFEAVDSSLIEMVHNLTSEEQDEFLILKDRLDANGGDTSWKDKCGTWQDEYTARHAESIEYPAIAASKSDAPSVYRKHKYVVHWCPPTGCGGLADHLLGVFGLFLYSIASNSTLLIQWEGDTKLSSVWDKSAVDVDLNYLYNFDAVEWTDFYFTNNGIGRIQQVFDVFPEDPLFPKTVDLTSNDTMTIKEKFVNSNFVRVQMNRGTVIQWHYDPNRRDFLEKAGLTLENTYRCLFNFLFKAKPEAQTFLNNYQAFLSLPSVFSVGIHIRAGDKSFTEDKVAQTEVVNYMKCAKKIARLHAKPGQRAVFVVFSDSQKTVEAIAEKYPNEILLTGFKPSHFDMKVEAFEKQHAFIDEQIFSLTDYQVISYSGFGRLGAFLSGSENRTLYMGSPTPDCDNDCPLKYSNFKELAHVWSMG